jgi:hypothetical protein
MLKFPNNLKEALEQHSGITFSTTAYSFELDNNKEFVGYYGYNINKDIFFRINFPLKRNKNIVSHIDFFDNIFSDTPNYTIIPIESTISNIVILITKGEKEPFLEKVIFRESLQNSRREQLFKYWIENNPNAKDAGYLTSSTVEDVFNKSFQKDDTEREVPLAWFRVKYKMHLASMGVQLKRGRKTGGKRERIIDDPVRRQELLDRKESFDFQKNLKVLASYVQGVIDKKTNALLIYGPPGTGKSHVVNEVIQKNNLIERKDYIVYSGGTKDPKSMARILYNNGGAKDDKPKLIFFDDFSIPKDSITIDMLAQVMDNNPLKSKDVTYSDPKVLSDWEKIKTKLDAERNEWIDSYIQKNKNKPSAKEIKDFEREQLTHASLKNKTPLSFPFYGQIIIVTNSIDIDPKLLSRTMKLLIDPTNEEIINVLKKDNFEPTIDPQAKKEIIELLEYISPGVRSIDFRDFFLAVQIRELLVTDGKDIWENKVIDNILMKEKD